MAAVKTGLKQILTGCGLEEKKNYLAIEVAKLDACLNSCHEEILRQVHNNLAAGREKGSQWEEEHITSLELLFQNETRKIELEILNTKPEDSYRLPEEISRTDKLNHLSNRGNKPNRIEQERKRTYRARDIISRSENRLQNAIVPLERPSTTPEGVRFQITLSIGVAENLPTDSDIKAIFERADQALNTSKKQGRNRIISNDLMSQEDHLEECENAVKYRIAFVGLFSLGYELLHSLMTVTARRPLRGVYAQKA